MLLNWVLCLITFVGVVIVSLLFVLMKVYQNSRWDDGLNDALLAKITDQDMDLMVRAFEKTKGQVDAFTTVKNYWEGLEMDVVKLKKYQVLRSYPHSTRKNEVTMYRLGEMLLKTTSTDVPSSISNNRSAFLAYSPARDVHGSAVYVNYAEDTDFEFLSSRNIGVAGRICLIRVGKLSKANQSTSFPEPIWIGDNALQHGTVARLLGDPLTPGYPSHVAISRLNSSERSCFPGDRLRIRTHNVFTVSTVRNVIAMWRGSIEPDRLVVLGARASRTATSPNLQHRRFPVCQLLQQSIAFRDLRRRRVASAAQPRLRALAVGRVRRAGLHRVGRGPRRLAPQRRRALRGQQPSHGYAVRVAPSNASSLPHAKIGLSSSLREVTKMVYPNGSDNSLWSTWQSRPHTPKNLYGEAMPLPVTGHSDDGPFAFSAGIPTLAVSFGVSLVQFQRRRR
ncbi:hypothetical protein MTO96_013768 [Rhipicephalus appendiculatus]